MNQSDLSLYKPQVDIGQVFVIDDNLPDNELAFELNKKIKIARRIQDATFIAIGKILKIIRDKKLYKNLDYENFTQYLNSEDVSFSREKAYLYIRIYETFVEKFALDPNEISKLGVVRLQMLAPIVRDMEDREEVMHKVEEAQLLPYNQFVRETKQQTNLTGKPTVYWSEETQKWIINFFDDITTLIPMGKFAEKDE